MAKYYIVKEIADGDRQIQYSAGAHFLTYSKELACLYAHISAANAVVQVLDYEHRESGMKFEVEEISFG